MAIPSILPDDKKPPRDQMPELGGRRSDLRVSIAKGVVGAIPLAGSVFAELIGSLIPEQRTERIELYIRLLNDRLGRLEEVDVPLRLSNPENVDLFEEGAFQSVRAFSNERKEYIATVVANGIAGEAKDRLESKRLLNLL